MSARFPQERRCDPCEVEWRSDTDWFCPNCSNMGRRKHYTPDGRFSPEYPQ